MNTQTHEVKLLVVDDELEVIEELSEVLRDSGYTCYTSQHAEQALEHFANDPQIGIVLCDLHMPGVDGLQLIEQLERAAGRDRPFQAIIFTGSTDSAEVIQAMRAGVADYFPKPIDTRLLLQSIQRIEKTIKDRADDYQRIAQLNEKLHSLAESINDLYENIHNRRLQPAQPNNALAGDNVSTPIPEAFKALSPRQLAVARLVSKGLTNYQIACELGITENTVKLYVSQVLRLTKMHNRTQLALALSPSRN